jgi:DNA-binding NarL/FixJ family response regulator
VQTPILLAENGLGIGEALKLTLEHLFRFQVIAVARAGIEALELCRRLRPSVVVTNLHLPGLDGVGLLYELRRRNLDIGVAFLTSEDDNLRLGKAADSQPNGFAHQADELAEWESAVRAAKNRTYYYSRRISDARRQNAARNSGASVRLSSAERDLLNHIVQGRTNAQIAAIRGTSERTVDNQRTTLRKKLGAHCTADLVRYALGSENPDPALA